MRVNQRESAFEKEREREEKMFFIIDTFLSIRGSFAVSKNHLEAFMTFVSVNLSKWISNTGS